MIPHEIEMMLEDAAGAAPKMQWVTVKVRASFRAKSAAENAKHIKALMKLLEKRAGAFKLVKLKDAK